MSRQRPRSSAVPRKSRGYQASGAEIVRPSESSTVRVSAVTATCVAIAGPASAVEVLIPTPQQGQLVLLDDPQHVGDLIAGESSAPLQPQRIEPELRLSYIPLDVH